MFRRTTFLFTLVALLVGVQGVAADYYWVGGTGNWSDFSNHWATTSNGSTFHTTAPTLSDDVYIDGYSYSSSDTLYIDVNATCQNIFLENAVGLLYANNTLTCSQTFEVTYCNVEMNGFDLNVNRLDASASSFLGARFINLANSTVNISGDGDAYAMTHSFNLSEDFTNTIFNFNYAGTNEVYATPGGSNIVYPQFNINVAEFNFLGGSYVDTVNVVAGCELRIEEGIANEFEVYQLNLNGDCGNYVHLKSSSATNQAYLDIKGQTLNETFLTVEGINGSNGTYNANNSIDQGNNTNWAINENPSNITYYWVNGTGNWSDPNHWSLTSGGAADACIPGPNDDVVFDNASGAGFTTTVDQIAYCRNMTWTTLSGNPDLAGTFNLVIRGSVVLDAPMTASFSANYVMQAPGVATITSNGVTLNGDVYFTTAAGVYSLLDNFQSNETIYIDSGQFSTGGFNVTAGSFDSYTSATRTIDISNSTVTLTGTGETWYMNPTTLTFTSTGSDININHANTNLSIFQGGGLAYATLRLYNLQTEIRDDNTFEVLYLNPGITANFETGSEQTFDSLNANGTCASPITIQSTSNTSPPGNFVQTGTDTLYVNYCNIYNITIDALPILRVNVANNSSLEYDVTGWTTGLPGIGTAFYWVGGAGNWSDLAHWESPSGTPAVCLPTIRDTVFFDGGSFLSAGDIVNTDINAECFRMDWTGSDAQSPFLNLISSVSVREDVILNSTVTITNSDTSAQLRFIPNLNHSVFTTFERPVNANVFFAGGTIADSLTLNGDLFMDAGSDVNIGKGIFDTNSDSIRCGVFLVSGVENKIIHLNASSLEVHNGVNFNDFSLLSNAVNLFPGTSHIHITGTSDVDFFAGDSLTYYDLTISAGTGTFSTLMTGANFFNDLTLNAGTRLEIDSARLQTVNGNFTAIGNCQDSIFVFSSGEVTDTDISLANPATVECLDITGINNTSANITALFSKNTANNTGITFSAAQSTTADFNVTYDYCLGDAVSFNNTSTAYAGGIGVLSFDWEFDDDTLTTDTSSLQDPTYVYTTGGVHYVTLTSTYTNFCTDTYLDSVRVNDPTFTMTTSVSDTTICAGDTVVFSSSAFSGTGTVFYDYQINNVSIQNLDSSVFTTDIIANGDVVTCIMNANGCVDTTDNVYTFTVNQNPNVNLTSSDADDIICDGDLVIFTGGGAEMYQFYIDGSPVTLLESTNLYASNTLVDGAVITLLGVDTSTSCSSTSNQTITMTVNPLPNPTLTTTDGDLVICAGDLVGFDAAGATQYEFFVNGISVQGPSGATNYSTVSLNNLDNVSVIGYTLGCPNDGDQDYTYFVNAIPNTLLSNNTGTSICEGTSVDFTAYNATTYEFYVNGTPVQGPSGNPNYTNGGLVSGDQVTVMGSSNGCSQLSNVNTFTVNPLPTVTLTCSDADSTICEGDTVTFTAGGASLYQFYLNGVPIGGSSANNVYVNGNLSNGDIVKVRGIQSGCFDFSNTEFPMTVIPQFNVNLFDSDFDDAICAGESVDFTGTGTAITQFELFVDGVSQGTNGTGNFSLSTLPIGNPQISLSGSKLGCTYFADDTLSFTVSPIPTIDMVSSDVDNVICDGDSIIFTASGGTTYEFLINSISQGVNTIDTLFSDGFNDGDVIDLIGYSGGCSSNSLSSFTITVDPIPPTVLSSSDVDNFICEGESITYTASGADNYEFFVGGVSQGPPSPTNVLTSNAFTGVQEIYVEGYNTGCSASSNSFTLTVNALPDIVVTISDADTSVCDGEVVTITGAGSGTYELMINGVSQGPATTNNVFNINTLVDGDQVSMQGDGINGCFNTSNDLYTFTVIPNPIVTMTSSDADSSICVGESVTFNASGASSYEYYVSGVLASTGAIYTTDSLTNGQIVQIYGTDNICSTYGNAIPFSVWSYPVTSIISDDGDETICQGDQVVFTGLGAFDFEFFVNGISVQGPSTQDSLITTTINDGDVITVEGGNQGCTTLSSGITYTVNQFPTTTLTSSDVDNQICFGDQVDFTSGGANEYEFFINGISQDPPSAVNLFSSDELNNGDVITVMGFDGECGALSTTTINMGVDVMPIELTVVPGNIICLGDLVDFTGTGADTYEFFIDGTSVQGPSAVNTYSTSALTDGQVVSLQGFLAVTGCTQWAPTSQLFVVMDNPVITALGSTTICEGDSVVLESDYMTWNQWYWDSAPLGGENDPQYEAYDAGTYHVEVTLGGVDEVWGLGNNIDGQLGDNSIDPSLSAVETIGATNIAEIESGIAYNLVRDNSGAVLSWGNNTYGQLGDGTFSSSLIPLATSITDAVDVAAGHEFGVAALSTGAVMTWGRNDMGQLGQGNFATTNFPFAITGLTNMVAVSAGENHVLALKDDGTVYAWGDNTFGQLGLGDLMTYNDPQLIPTISGIASIHTGDNHSFAVDSTGQLFVWGNNAHGQLGENGILFSNVPIQNTIPNVLAADGGTDHSLVLTTNQKVYTFGNNDFGQLGNGTTVSEYNPQKMDTLDAVIHVEAAFYQSAVIKGDNSTWTWGRNDAGQLGTENTVQQNVPNYIPNLTGAVDFGMGQDHTSYIVTQENSCASNTIDVIVNPEPDVIITGFGGLLTATPPGDAYQWFIDGIEIVGGTTQSIVPTSPGWYTCEVTYPGGCTSLSDPFAWGVVGVTESDEFAYSVYPNPTNGILNIQGNFYQLEEVQIELLNALGQVVHTHHYAAVNDFISIDLSHLERGTYALKITSRGQLKGLRRIIIQ